MGSLRFGYLFLMVSLVRMSSAEFVSDVDSNDRDEAKALEIKAKDFWQSLMDSSQALETTDNALLGAAVDKALENLSPEDKDIHDFFQASVGHLAKADSMLFEEAAIFKILAAERLDNGPSRDALSHSEPQWADSFYNAIAGFIGYKSYEKRLARHIMSRLKEIKSGIHHGVRLAPEMLAESRKASDRAYDVLHSRDGADGKKNLPIHLRTLANQIVSATGKQRLRFTKFLLSSFMTAAVDIAGKKETAAKTVMKASLRGFPDAQRTAVVQSGPVANSDPVVQVEAAIRIGKAAVEKEPAVQIEASIHIGKQAVAREPAIQIGMQAVQSEPATINVKNELKYRQNEKVSSTDRTTPHLADVNVEIPPIVFFDGIPVGAKTMVDYNMEQVVDV